MKDFVHSHWILDDDGEPRIVSLLEWARWVEDHPEERIVRKTYYEHDAVKVEVSTIFLGIDHGFGQSKKPVLWETMVFGGPLDKEMYRYTSKAEALLGHDELCGKVMVALGITEEKKVQ